MTNSETLSACCNAPIDTVIASEGTSHWECSDCELPCDPAPPETPFWNGTGSIEKHILTCAQAKEGAGSGKHVDCTCKSPPETEGEMVVGIDYGTPDGDKTVALVRDIKTGEMQEIPLVVAEYIQSLQSSLSIVREENAQLNKECTKYEARYETDMHYQAQLEEERDRAIGLMESWAGNAIGKAEEIVAHKIYEGHSTMNAVSHVHKLEAMLKSDIESFPSRQLPQAQ